MKSLKSSASTLNGLVRNSLPKRTLVNSIFSILAGSQNPPLCPFSESQDTLGQSVHCLAKLKVLSLSPVVLLDKTFWNDRNVLYLQCPIWCVHQARAAHVTKKLKF